MKINQLLPLVLCICSLFLLSESCKKETENLDPCAAVTCQNHAQCICGTCTCPEGFAGDSCQYVLDIDGNEYRTVTIGEQVWMSSNLLSTKCNDGTSIPLVEDTDEWFETDSPGYCWYNNDEAGQKEKGFSPLYNFYVIRTCDICPSGFRVPKNEDWNKLIAYIGGEEEANKLKGQGTEDWFASNAEAVNETEWSGLPVGVRRHNGSFLWQGAVSNFLSTSTDSTDAISVVILSGPVPKVEIRSFANWYGLNSGFSIRCLQE